MEKSEAKIEACVICASDIVFTEAVWNCERCYLTVHLDCIKRWILNRNQGYHQAYDFTCPTCKQGYRTGLPKYRCYCGRVKNPKPCMTAPHSCKQYCARELPKCNHVCTALCHQGKCPDCTQVITLHCGCGRSKIEVSCSDKANLTCGETCDRVLNCGFHRCKRKCHIGECQSCDIIVEVPCYCSKISRLMVCSKEDRRYFCESKCGKMLLCGNHKCDLGCHPGTCMECPYKPNIPLACPCGRSSIPAEMNPGRLACTDEFTNRRCELVCSKKLEGNGCRHYCPLPCHDGPCPPCQLRRKEYCRCRHTSR